jgi:hypothetical protein
MRDKDRPTDFWRCAGETTSGLLDFNSGLKLCQLSFLFRQFLQRVLWSFPTDLSFKFGRNNASGCGHTFLWGPEISTSQCAMAHFRFPEGIVVPFSVQPSSPRMSHMDLCRLIPHTPPSYRAFGVDEKAFQIVPDKTVLPIALLMFDLPARFRPPVADLPTHHDGSVSLVE